MLAALSKMKLTKEHLTIMKVSASVIILVYILMKNKPGKYVERFLSPGEYPRDQTFPLLYEDYPLKEPKMELSKLGSEQLYKFYPVFPANSTKINNIRYWKTPNNGKCSPAEFCDAYYGPKSTPINVVNPPVPEWGPDRVNYYESTSASL